MDTQEKRRQIAKHIHKIVGGTPRFSRYADRREQSFVDIMAIEDKPVEGLNVYSTVGTSEYSIGLEIEGRPLRVELIIAIDKTQRYAPEILSTCAFCIMNSKYRCRPGAIFKDVVGQFISDSDMKHVLLMDPFLWEEEYCELKIDGLHIEWLLVVPISERERQYAEQYGNDALMDLFEEADIDVHDLYRESIVS